MDWWQKLRRAWAIITARLLNARKNGNDEKCKGSSSPTGKLEASSSNHSDNRQGFLKLQDEVETCEYEDVHVLWNILKQAHAEEKEAVAEAETSSSSETNKQQHHKHSWKAYLCPITHQHTAFALLSI